MKTNLNNIELFNVAQVKQTEKGVILFRIPENVCDCLNAPEFDENGNQTGVYIGQRDSAKCSVGVEMRFFSNADSVTVTVKTKNGGEVLIYNGDYLNISNHIPPDKEVTLKAGWNDNLNGLKRKKCNRYNKRVWRIYFACYSPIEVIDLHITGRYRIPLKKELPKKTVLAYGSSISQGCGTIYNPLCYLNTAANILGVDIKNKAIAAGCYCEKEMLDYLLTESFDVGYFELGTNLADRPLWFIEERMGNLINAICQKFADKKLFFITPITGLSDISSTALDYKENYEKTRKIILQYAGKYQNVTILDGHKLADKDYYLCADALHPSDFGHVMMGVNLAKMLKNKI